MYKSKHLEFAKQTYFEHMKDSLYYFGVSLKSSFFFLVHAFIPDLFLTNGSENISHLNDTITKKYKELELDLEPKKVLDLELDQV